ncbi:MAG TPA: 16S rRNA (guanine(527)-N(7))-methyltransferase RsmG [Nocardioides sp.]|nr:16S rRNA (guanine(527)-N(7))-methyltransferase RsmG [Nocardioides sp.]
MFPSDRMELAERYAGLLATDGVVRGLIGPREVPRLWDRHLVNCALLADLVPPGADVCDIGSGAGLPGLVLAIARTDLQVTLVEPLLRRTTFLEEAVTALGLDHVEVVRGRADSLHGRRRFAVVTSRAVAPLDRLLGWSMPLVEPTGALVAMKGSSIGDEIEAARPVLAELGCAEPEVRILGEGIAPSTTVAVRVAWADPGQVSWPLPAPGPRTRSKQSTSKRRRRP